ncbi:hypothetical protein [Nocardia carnea]|uniref:hypothetical protein n=1 Tax=Nocardia carnea TaxID=37328 RepID=UPI0024587857|nr:hypothetical protein [Nocardia carnea]
MAVRYSKREQTKLVNRVKKLIAQGKTVNAACTSVSEREGGQPAANTLANWVKAAGLPEAEPVQEEAAPVAAPKKRRRRTTTRKPAPAAAISAPETQVKAPEPEQEPEREPVTEHTEIPATESAASPSAEAGVGAEAQPVTETATASVAELVHVRTADRTAETTGDLDDLLDENLRLRTALNEAMVLRAL